MKKIVFSRAPVRICDIGGWTDTWFYPRGAVFNFCVDLYNYVIIKETNKNYISLYSENLKKGVKISNYEQIELNGNLDLLKAVIKKMKVKGGMDIIIRSEIPPGCGTGTSASVCVSLIGALQAYLGHNVNHLEVAEIAHQVETETLKLQSGVQDQYAAAIGGINLMEIDYPTVKATNINLSKQMALEFENSLILLLFGSRSSDEMHKAVIDKYLKGDELIKNLLDQLKSYAYEMREAIKRSIFHIGEVMNKNWDSQKRLHPLMVNKTILNAEKISQKHDAIGFKCNGAGGGGSATILAHPEKVFALKTDLNKKGYTILPCKLNSEGLFAYVQ